MGFNKVRRVYDKLSVQIESYKRKKSLTKRRAIRNNCLELMKVTQKLNAELSDPDEYEACNLFSTELILG